MHIQPAHPLAPAPSPLRTDLEDLGSASHFVEDIVQVIDRVSLFGEFSLPEIEALCAHMRCWGARRNTVLLNEGDAGNHLILLLTGEVAVVKKDVDGNPRQLAVAAPGATLGEMSMIDGQPRCASCITLDPTDFAVLTREGLNGILTDAPRLGNKLLLVLLQMLAGRLRDAGTELVPHMAWASL